MGAIELSSSCSSSLSSGGGACHTVTEATLFGQSCPAPCGGREMGSVKAGWGEGGDFGSLVALRISSESQNRSDHI